MRITSLYTYMFVNSLLKVAHQEMGGKALDPFNWNPSPLSACRTEQVLTSPPAQFL